MQVHTKNTEYAIYMNAAVSDFAPLFSQSVINNFKFSEQDLQSCILARNSHFQKVSDKKSRCVCIIIHNFLGSDKRDFRA